MNENGSELATPADGDQTGRTRPVGAAAYTARQPQPCLACEQPATYIEIKQVLNSPDVLTFAPCGCIVTPHLGSATR